MLLSALPNDNANAVISIVLTSAVRVIDYLQITRQQNV